MQLGIGKTLFPSWTAAGTLVTTHGVAAASHARNAIRADGMSARLDHAVLAMTSFDHAIDNSRKLPVQWLVRRAPMYYRGYEAAKQAVSLLVGSGLIPGAKERVGRQSLVAARETFLAGVDASRRERGRFGVHLASGWLEATAEDALAGVRLLESGATGSQLLAGINHVRAAVLGKRAIDDALVQSVTALFDRAGSELTSVIDSRATRTSMPVDATAFERSGVLLAQAEAAAKLLAADADAALRAQETQAA